MLTAALNPNQTATTIYASTPLGPVPVLLDLDDAERLGDRKCHVGSHGYPQLHHDGQSTPLHRWLLDCERGDGKIVDHIDGDKFNARRANLRLVTAQENAANRRCTAASGFRGVSSTPAGHWVARVKIDGQNIHLGTYASPEEAARVSHTWRTENLPGYLGRAITSVTTASAVAA